MGPSHGGEMEGSIPKRSSETDVCFLGDGVAAIRKMVEEISPYIPKQAADIPIDLMGELNGEWSSPS